MYDRRSHHILQSFTPHHGLALKIRASTFTFIYLSIYLIVSTSWQAETPSFVIPATTTIISRASLCLCELDA